MYNNIYDIKNKRYVSTNSRKGSQASSVSAWRSSNPSSTNLYVCVGVRVRARLILRLRAYACECMYAHSCKRRRQATLLTLTRLYTAAPIRLSVRVSHPHTAANTPRRRRPDSVAA